MEIHTTLSPLAWRLLVTSCWLDKECHKEDTWTCIHHPTSLQTLIEMHLNNRPLTYISTDLDELEPLTPSHLLYSRIINTVPHPLTEEEKIINENFQETGLKLHHTLSKKAKTQALIIQHFWSQWKREYLTSLRETHTNNIGTDKERIRVGDVVIIHDDITRLKWHLTVVQELQHGNDGFIRSTTIRTTNALLIDPSANSTY